MWFFSKNKKEKIKKDAEHEEHVNDAHASHTEEIAGDMFEDDESVIPADNDGELAIDVFQENGHIVIQAPIAGIQPDNIDIDIDRDTLTIRGERLNSFEIDEGQYYHKECHWGTFSRSIVLPSEVKADEAEADFEDGILTISIPKAKKKGSVNIRVKK